MTVAASRGRFHPGDLNDALGKAMLWLPSRRAAVNPQSRTGRVRPAPYRDSTDPQRAFQRTASLPDRVHDPSRCRGASSPISASPACEDDAVTAQVPGPVSVSSVIGPTRPRKRGADQAASRAANRRWWDADADAYHQEHGEFLGDADFVWCPENLREADADLLGDVRGRRILEVGCGSAPCARYLARQGATVVAFDLSAGMLAHATAAAGRTGTTVPLIQADVCEMPFADGSFDLAFSAFGAMPFVDDSAGAMREVA